MQPDRMTVLSIGQNALPRTLHQLEQPIERRALRQNCAGPLWQPRPMLLISPAWTILYLAT